MEFGRTSGAAVIAIISCFTHTFLIRADSMMRARVWAIALVGSQSVIFQKKEQNTEEKKKNGTLQAILDALKHTVREASQGSFKGEN